MFFNATSLLFSSLPFLPCIKSGCVNKADIKAVVSWTISRVHEYYLFCIFSIIVAVKLQLRSHLVCGLDHWIELANTRYS
jgi:hypothetical protein